MTRFYKNNMVSIKVACVLSAIFYLILIGQNGIQAQLGLPGAFTVSGVNCSDWPAPFVEINFTISRDATSYDVERRPVGGSWAAIITELTFTPARDITVVPGSNYEYRVIAVNSAGRTISSNTALIAVNSLNCSGVTPTSAGPGDFDINCQLCNKPNNDVLDCYDKTTAPRVDFTWTESANAVSYQVYYKNTSIGSWTGPVATGTNRRYAAGVSLDSQNHYYIRAVDSSGQFKSCSISYIPNRGGGCKALNVPYASSDEGAEANCQLPPPPPPSPTPTPTPTPIPDILPVGNIDQADCTAIAGWALDQDTPTASIFVDIYRDGPIGTGTLLITDTTSILRNDVNVTYSTTGNHGFYFSTPLALKDGTAHTVYVYGINSNGAGPNPLLPASPVTIQCTVIPPPPPGPPPPPPDISAPIISNVRIINITTSSATVTWDTNEPANSQVEYCLSSARCGTVTPVDPSLVINHSVNLTGLSESTVYSFWVKSADGAGNLRTAGSFSFKTGSSSPPPPPPPPPPPFPPPPPPPNPVIITNVQVTNITRDSVTISWDTDRLADSRIYRCSFATFCPTLLLSDSNLTTSHIFNISGLQADRNYRVRIFSTDASGNQGFSGVIYFKTNPGLVISGLGVINITNSSFTVVWNTDYPSDSRLIYCRYIFLCYFRVTSIYDPTLTVVHSITAPNLSPDTIYYYRIKSTDPLGYVNQSSLANIRTLP